ncbi:tRNA uridine 5-carboxymethylaminomethyl modification enzyme [Breznakia sp. PF5-3]|uniref:tRNA uridine-5-carboxymethylaminomethyl(34) synthesis enzyme MnmG n=1 Tax=unclassified Breznakia TaxID=2623764 RepID=UPI0024052180|nr:MULTISPECIES: tRNA uridine-5-carboxymethylaminomethyl(34) synthesis enzyme MnmG [unclassified Breznakia]MDF9825850.1 tRNA uridine 5-carboxymethylaminomethyl modification enzyme [Breznakia sp. PM6-1]MDF9836657.1 tRNA uridine 5-carboxymethylaminomethyl modification enzyme [Breznakia sp. PF5-3]MDF9838152.1 tRNA uridine 5-carboxymethylaminomethyl modification enzyme [Breznakia sp. PFB2-8]MDF9860138.1 tRNA uridine 5-carboxymethylaminomethyl modification enzyme [Breznakia sp. PH5-24]
MVDIIVVGGGHAGVEAALACARMNKQTVLFTLDINAIAKMPCNPSVGGPAKGIVVREIDALGGEMGKAADATALQFKMLNTNKGPGVRCLRVQSDKLEYSKYMQKVLLNTDNLMIREAMIEELVVEDGVTKGVRLTSGEIVYAKSVILTTGTYMSGKILIGHTATESGPDNEPTTNNLSASLRALGIETFRLKTGTPARVKTDTIDFSKTEMQPGSEEFVSFSYETKKILPFAKQEVCYLTYTSKETHDVINSNLDKSAMYSGLVEGVGPRYCPSIEDKLVRFKDKERHQIFLEPESRSLDTTYVQGFSTSMPYDIQEKMIHSLPGLENAKIEIYGYAIEYDAIDPLQCKPTLESKKVDNLYTAGQINGTSGYEEAAAQGLMAAINACLKQEGKEPFILRRDEAYIGVMIDDLVNKGTKEPYRLLTSRAEYRLLLRHDNADQRLSTYGYKIGLLKKERYLRFCDKQDKMKQLLSRLHEIRFTPKSDINEYLQTIGYEMLDDGISAYELLKRPKVELKVLKPYLDFDVDEEVIQAVEIEVKYEGYIVKAKKEAERLLSMDNLKLPAHIDYDKVENLSLEAHQKLSKVRPLTVGQASRISGVNPADIAVLMIYLKKQTNKEK